MSNPFLILWLRSDCDEKILNKRYKELLNFLSIDEIGSYKDDLPFIDYKKIRTEESVKEAFHRLTSQHKRIYDTFFWFQLIDEEDESYFSDIVKWSEKRLKLFNKTKKYHYLKNHILSELLLLENEKKFKNLSFIDVPWNIAKRLYELINSESFWREFKEILNIQNEISIRDDMIKSFREEIPQFIAESFFDLSEELWKAKIYKEYSKIFWISAKQLDDNKNVTESIKEIENTINNIKSLDLVSDLDEIIEWANIITSEIKKLERIWLNNSPKIIKLKDEFSRELRSMAISLFNDHDDKDNAINFIEEAKKIAHSNSLKEKLNKDIEDMNEQWEKTEMFKSILDLHKEGQEYFTNKHYKSAEKIYSWCIKLIIEELSEKFNLETQKLHLLISKIEAQFNMISLWWKTAESVIDNIDNMKKMVREDWGFSWWDDLNFWWLWGDQRLLLMILIDAATYRKMSNIIENRSSSNSNSETKFPWWIIWIIIAIIAIASNS